MGVTYELIDAPYPFVSAIYTCPCGRHEVRHAAEAGSPPADWVEHRPDGRPERYICPECAQSRGNVPPASSSRPFPVVGSPPTRLELDPDVRRTAAVATFNYTWSQLRERTGPSATTT